MTTTKQPITIRDYADMVRAGWHEEDTVCYQDSRGILQRFEDRQTILYLPGPPHFYGSGASCEQWISYPDADECRADAEALRARVRAASSLEEAGRIVSDFYDQA